MSVVETFAAIKREREGEEREYKRAGREGGERKERGREGGRERETNYGCWIVMIQVAIIISMSFLTTFNKK